MHKTIKTPLMIATISSLLSVNLAFAATDKTTDPKVTGQPTVESGPSGLTPMDQRFGSEQDVEITRKIRERLTSIKDLSVSAQNVKIITLDKKVNLVGEVNSEKEKTTVIQAAKKIAGNNNVTSEIVVHK